MVYVHIPKSLRRKLDPKSQKLLFVGYSETQKTYRFFDRSTHKNTVSRDAIFSESHLKIEAISETSKLVETPPSPNFHSTENDLTNLPTESVATIYSFSDSSNVFLVLNHLSVVLPVFKNPRSSNL